MTTPAGPRSPIVRAVVGAVTAVTAAIAIVGVTVALFFNPLWIEFEQERSGVPAITGYTSDQVRAVTGSILADLFVGPPDFDAAVDGQPVLGAAERSHMVDVRNVLLPAMIVFGAAIAILAVLLVTRWRRRWLWRAIALGSSALVAAALAIGIAIAFFFDAAFLLFHRVFFPQGNFTFDPRTQRLTQLFPEQFWTDTSIAIALAGLLIAIAASIVAWRRAARLPA